MLTITVRKPSNVHSTYVYHGVRNELGGSFETNHAGISFKAAIQYELDRLPAGPYQVEVNGKITQSGIKS